MPKTCISIKNEFFQRYFLKILHFQRFLTIFWKLGEDFLVEYFLMTTPAYSWFIRLRTARFFEQAKNSRT